MEEKNYLQYVEQVEGCNRLFDNEVAKAADQATKAASDWRLSAKGKEDKKKEVFATLNKTTDMITTVAKKSIGNFCKDFSINLPEDGNDHAKDIENALKIVDMLGFNLDVRNLENAISPMKGSFRSMKTVVDLIHTKQKNAAQISQGGLGFSSEVLAKTYDYMGINNRVIDYLNLFNNIQSLIDNPGDGYRFEVTSRGNATTITLQPIISYGFLACADWMRQCGQAYADLENDFLSLFTGHIATDHEILEKTIRGN